MFSEVSGFNLGELLDNVTDFLDTFFNDVMNSEMTGLIMYLFGCIPPFIRSFMIFAVVLCVILVLFNILRSEL